MGAGVFAGGGAVGAFLSFAWVVFRDGLDAREHGRRRVAWVRSSSEEVCVVYVCSEGLAVTSRECVQSLLDDRQVGCSKFVVVYVSQRTVALGGAHLVMLHAERLVANRGWSCGWFRESCAVSCFW